jgi:hypothetical protein
LPGWQSRNGQAVRRLDKTSPSTTHNLRPSKGVGMSIAKLTS